MSIPFPNIQRCSIQAPILELLSGQSEKQIFVAHQGSIYQRPLSVLILRLFLLNPRQDSRPASHPRLYPSGINLNSISSATVAALSDATGRGIYLLHEIANLSGGNPDKQHGPALMTPPPARTTFFML